jgi:hypothetical protein
LNSVPGAEREWLFTLRWLLVFQSVVNHTK